MNCGENIKKVRMKLGWSLTKLSLESGVSKPYLSQIENTPNKQISAEKLYRIATALGVTMGQLMGTELIASDTEDIPESLKLFAKKEQLSEDQVQMLANIKYRGKQPTSVKDWEYIYQTIKIAIDRGE